MRPVNNVQYKMDDSELLLVFVIFRHGDRTPSDDEISTFPSANINNTIFYPFGLKALTNEGKMHGYNIGEYLRRRFNGFLSDLYLPEEISIRSTHSRRTKMTVLTTLAGLYPPNEKQKWNNLLNWQPISYHNRQPEDDDLLVHKSCPIYQKLKEHVYELPEIYNKIVENEGFLKSLSEKTGYDFNTTKDVHRFNNLIHGLENVGMTLPQWVNETKPKIQELTDLEFKCKLYTPQLKRLGGGVTVKKFIKASKAIIAGDPTQAKVHLLAASESSVAGFMAATTVFTKPHQPGYGASFYLELRKNKTTNEYGVMASYATIPGDSPEILLIPDCGGTPICNFNTFLDITKDYAISRKEY